MEFIDHDGTVVRFETEVETPVVWDAVRFTRNYRRVDGTEQCPSAARCKQRDAMEPIVA